MAKRVPNDCKRIKVGHLRGLTLNELTVIAQRIEVQTQDLNRTRRLVFEALDGLAEDEPS